MLRVGLTGGIGSGKSTVAARLAEHGAMVIDADRIAREVVEPGTDGLAELVEAFGSGVLDGTRLDRAALAATVFDDDQARRTLNAIVHPRIGARTAELINEAPAESVIVHDVPLLVENGLAPAYHVVIVVDADEQERIRRLVQTRDMTEQQARARIASQATVEQRREVADVWLDNTADRHEVLEMVDRVWADRLVPFEANVRLHRIAARSGPSIVAPDPDWPRQARRLIDRLVAATGHQVEHIGSTSVPGLAAKDVIDLQLLLPDVARSAELETTLAVAGFPRYPGDHNDALADGTPEPKALHGNADPARRVHLHVREQGSAAAHHAVQFRDWLRDDELARADYEQLKRDLAQRFADDPDAVRYAEAKEPWFARVRGRFQRE